MVGAAPDMPAHARGPAQEPALILFVRKPELGRVKTRLAAALGPQKALEIYQYLLEHTRQIALQFPGMVYVFHTGDEWNLPLGWNQPFFIPVPQLEHPSLGSRMQHAFSHVFSAGHTRAIIIGSDCALLSPAHIQDATEALLQYDAVLGPATDGGYYLLGITHMIDALFAAIPWSSAEVLAASMRALEDAHKSHTLLAPLPDTDEPEDLIHIPAYAHLARR